MKAGVIDGDHLFKPENGVLQRYIISPLLSNIYQHEVLDRCLEEIRPMLRGEMFLIRFADDFVFGLEKRKMRGWYLTLFQNDLVSMVLPFTWERPGC